MAKLIRIVVDTDSYAGNFERELCAYVTGQFGACGVGEDSTKLFSEQITHLEWWNKHIVKRGESREYPCKRPVSIYWSSKRGGYNSVAIFVKKLPPEDVLIEFSERVKEFCNNRDLIKAQLHNYEVKDPMRAALRMLMGIGGQPIDLTTVVNKEVIMVDGIRMFEGIKDEVLVSEMAFHGQLS